MGNTLTAPSLVGAQTDLPTLLLDVPAYVHQAVLGGGKIFKTLHALHEDGDVVLKLYVRRSSDFDLKRFEARLAELGAKLTLANTPSILNLVKIEITQQAVYLGRQYLAHNLVDRFHVHPSLACIEKQWFTYQMLHAVHQLHSNGVRHGDIKTSNFLLTSWNWLFLVDIAFYKPTFLPNDNPADYHFYFDNGTMGSNGMITQNAKRRCYLAPERFYSVITDRRFLEPGVSGGSGGSDGQVSEAMDIFSLGACIAELFLDGEQVLFDLPQLLAYREGAYDPTPLINKIPYAEVRLLIKHMIQRDPAKRLSAKQYMKMFSTGTLPPEPLPYTTPASPVASFSSPPLAPTTSPLLGSVSSDGTSRSTLFPSYFAYLYRFFAKLLTPELADPDIKIQALSVHRDAIIREVLGHEYMEQQARLMDNPPSKDELQEEEDAEEATNPSSEVPTAEQVALARELSNIKNIAIQARASNRSSPGSAPTWTCRCCAGSQFASQDLFSAHILSTADTLVAHAALFCVHCPPVVKQGQRQVQAIRALAAHHKRQHGISRTQHAPIQSASHPAQPPHQSQPSAISSQPLTPTPQGKQLLAELSQFGSTLTSRTTGLRSLEELQAEALAIQIAASAKAAGALTPITSALPTNSPLLSPAATPSAATLLDLASAVNPTCTPMLGAASSAQQATTELEEFSLDPAAPALAAVAPAPVVYHGNGLTMISSIVCSCLQNVRYPITKLTALELLANFGAFVDDEVRLGRLVPYAVSLLTDESAMVRSTSCHILTKLLSQVHSINSGSDAHIFNEYLFPSLSRLPTDPEEIVRLAYAQNIAELAASSKRFLDLAQHARQAAARQATDDKSPPPAGGAPPAVLVVPFDGAYATDLATLQDTVLKLIIDMLTLGGQQRSNAVKRALLADITRLCVFMGRRRVNNDLLPHLITLLNDRCWQLRSAFFEYIVGVSVFVGRVAFANFILPCIEQALFDTQEFVIQRAVHALTALSQLGLFEKRTMLEVAAKAGPLLCHPSAWVRAEAVKFMSSMSTELGPAKSLVFLAPVLCPFLAARPESLPDLSVESLQQHLKPALTRDEFRSAVSPMQREESGGQLASPSRPTSTAKSIPATQSQQVTGFGGESFVGPSRLLESTAGMGASWVDHSPIGRAPPSKTSTSRFAQVDEESEDSLAPAMGDSVDSVSASTSGFKADPALFAIMSTYLARVSSAMQSKSLQSPSASSATAAAAAAAEQSTRLVAMDEDSMIIELQNLSLSQILEESLPLHQLDIEPTAPELGSVAAANAVAFERAAQDTFDSLGVVNDRRVARPVAPTADPSLPTRAGAAGPGLTASASGQGGHPVPLRESLSQIPEYIKRALGVPLAPPALGTLRPDWTSHSTFYANHRVLSTSPEALAMSETYDPKLWRPKGVLVATLTEHRHVRTMAVSRDNLFLASGGDEGVVKIWDSSRLKLTAHARSQVSYVQHGRITSLAVCDSSHAVASASSNGSLHVFKVEYLNDEGSNNGGAGGNAVAPRYVGLSDVRRVDPDPVNGEGAILRVAHFNTLSESLLLYGTQKAVHGWDLRSKRDSFDLKLEPSMGLLTTMDIGPSPYVCVTGTSRGFLTVWDLRFQLPVQVWRHSAKTAITQLTSFDAPSILPKEAAVAHGTQQYPHPTKGPLFFAAAEGTNQIAGFDIYTGESRMLFRVLNPTMSASNGASSNPSGAAGASYPNRTRQKVRVSPLSLPSLRSYIRSDYATGPAAQLSSSTPYHPAYSSSSGFYHSLMGVTLDDSFLREFATMGSPDHAATAPPSNSINSFLVCKDSFALTAGTDRKVRYWDMRDPADSYRVSSDDLADGDYLRYNSRLENTTVVLEEVQSANSGTPSSAATDVEDKMRLKVAMAKKNAGQVPPSTAHTSEIMDMKAIEFPQKMLATASRDGVIKIWI